jgi:subtilisin family serine protease
MMLHVKFSIRNHVIFVFFIISCGFNSLLMASDLIAIIDSGLEKNLPQVAGFNFFEDTPDTNDEINHGSALAREILEVNPKVQFLPVKVTKNGDGITPDILAKAINFSVEKNVKIINLSFAMSQGSEALKKAVKNAKKKNILLVAAAGIGLKNPFEPVNVSTIFPQSYAEVLVVGKSADCKSPSSDSNFGGKIGFYIRESETKKRGSSYAAARATGLLSLQKNWQPYKKNLCLDSQKLIEANR